MKDIYKLTTRKLNKNQDGNNLNPNFNIIKDGRKNEVKNNNRTERIS